MPLTKSTESLIGDLTASIKRDLLAQIEPALRKLAEGSSELEAALKGTMAQGRRRGRPPGAKSATPSGPPAKTRRRRGSKRPRGMLKETIRGVLANAAGPLKLSQVRDGILRDSNYAGSNPKALYTQVIHTLRRIPEVSRSPKGEYTLKGRK